MLLKYKYIVVIQNIEIEYCMVSIDLHCLIYTLSILDNSSHGYSLRGKQLSSIPRFNSRFMKDSLRYKGSVLWNIVEYHNQQKSFSSFLELRKHVVNRAYFKDFNFNALSASTTRHRHSDFIYN